MCRGFHPKCVNLWILSTWNVWNARSSASRSCTDLLRFCTPTTCTPSIIKFRCPPMCHWRAVNHRFNSHHQFFTDDVTYNFLCVLKLDVVVVLILFLFNNIVPHLYCWFSHYDVPNQLPYSVWQTQTFWLNIFGPHYINYRILWRHHSLKVSLNFWKKNSMDFTIKWEN